MSTDCSQPTDAITVAVLGSGPSGCYTAQSLRKKLPNAEITIFEALPVPYGLLRYGVAPDHQGTKAVAAQFDRLFERSNITFIGNTRVGSDIDFAAVADAFDVVVVATGLPSDKPLDVPRNPEANVLGAGRLLRALNSFPEEAVLWGAPPLIGSIGDDVIVVGQGNVAMDVTRLIVKSPAHLTGSDIDDRVLTSLRPRPPRSVRVVGRSPAQRAKFDLAMLRELCALDSVDVAIEGLDDSVEGPVADVLRQATRDTVERADSARTLVTFHFGAEPREIRYEDSHTVLDVMTSSGELDHLRANVVITAIGFCASTTEADGTVVGDWSGRHVYRAGWLEREGRGNIAENRKHAQEVAKKIVDDLTDGHIGPGGRPGLQSVLPRLTHPIVDFTGWQAIDAAERESADDQRCRRKLTTLETMLAVAQEHTRKPL